MLSCLHLSVTQALVSAKAEAVAGQVRLRKCRQFGAYTESIGIGPFFVGENTVNRLPKGHFERFRSENTPRFHGGNLAPARDPALREPKAGVTIAKSVPLILPTT